MLSEKRQAVKSQADRRAQKSPAVGAHKAPHPQQNNRARKGKQGHLYRIEKQGKK